ncbi:MAG: DUF342 domain-containing protein [Desulfobacteraceae bacterium]|nr:DUF342 domain-containing protein [Desulfobacteraceae bacterium]
MNTQDPTSDQPLSGDRLQDKADILENNLFNAASKSNDKINIHFKISREQFPDPVIIKALLQLFPRINIKGSKILLILRTMLTRTIPKDNQLKIEKQLLKISEAENPLSKLSLTLKIALTSKLLHMTIKGTPVIPCKDGTIAKAFFDHKSCPGMLLKDGVIDYREINKYPIVKAGDNLFFILPESQGKPGMGYDGQIIHVPNALPLEFNLNGGVHRIDSRDKEGKNMGYFLKADKTGVVLLTRTDNIITGIEISDELDVKRLDYSTGNIGTNFICPISMKIDTICSGFKIRAKGMVEANVLEGGEIETERQAQLHTIMPGSKVIAQKDIIVNFSRNSTLTSETGCITILDELVDSILFSSSVFFEKNKGIMTGNTLDAETLSLKNIYFCGENTIYFGRRLFAKRQLLFELRDNLEDKVLSLDEEEKESMEKFHHELKRLTRAIKKNLLLLDNLKRLILATRTMDYETIDIELETIGKLMNTKEVSITKKRLETLKLFPGKNKDFEAKKDNLVEEIRKINKKMSLMSLTVEGLLRRAGTVKIFTGAVEKEVPRKPEIFIESERNEDTFIKIHCTYNARKGFKIIQN